MHKRVALALGPKYIRSKADQAGLQARASAPIPHGGHYLREKRSQDGTRKQETKNDAAELSSVEVMRNTRWYICILF